MRYRMIGIDLDDTLLDGSKRITPENHAAIRRAQDAQVLIVPCTGRVWHKAKSLALDELPNMTVGVFHDGAMVCDIASGRMRWHTAMPDELTAAILERFADSDYALVFCRVSRRLGYDYVVRGNHLVDRITSSWLADVRHRVTVDPDAGAATVRDTLGVRLVTDDQAATGRAQEIIDKMDGADQLFCHELWFADQGLHILQVYHRNVDKWPALQRIAREHDIGDDQIAYIGDQINDVTAIRESACGIAMANAVAQAKKAADHITHDCGISGVAHAIDQLMAGRWG